MICKKCKIEMVLDDKDVISKNNFDKYWICEKCGMSCVEKIRNGMLKLINWNNEND